MLMPFVILMVYEANPFVMTSIAQWEHSSNAGGLILWPVKALLLAGFLLLALQGVSEIIKRIAVMRGLIADPYEGSGTYQIAEDISVQPEKRL
jgi:TRAP-type mannitol/chloroaromatic compound transport system permease small subunit